MNKFRYSGGSFRTLKNKWRYSGGSWRKLKAKWRYSGGEWRKIFSALPAIVFSGSVSGNNSSPSGPVTTSFTVKNDGTITATGQFGTLTYLDSTGAGVGDSFEFKITSRFGQVVTGISDDVWYALTSDKTGSITKSTGTGSVTSTFSIVVRETGNASTEVTQSLNSLTAEII